MKIENIFNIIKTTEGVQLVEEVIVRLVKEHTKNGKIYLTAREMCEILGVYKKKDSDYYKVACVYIIREIASTLVKNKSLERGRGYRLPTKKLSSKKIAVKKSSAIKIKSKVAKLDRVKLVPKNKKKITTKNKISK